MAHRLVEAAARVVPIEIVAGQGLGEGDLLALRGQGDHGRQGVEHVVAADLVGAVGEAVRMGGVGRSQQHGGGVHRAGGQHHEVAGPALLAVLGGADHLGDRAAGGIGLQLDDLAAGEQGDVRRVQQRLDGDGAGVGLGLEQARIAAAGLALDAGGGDRMSLVQPDPDRQGEGPPALVLPMALQCRNARVMMDGGIGVGGLVAVLGGIVPPCAVHEPEPLGLVVIGRQLREADGPGGRDPAGVRGLLEILVAQPEQRRAIEGGVAADPVVGVGSEGLVPLVVPALLGAVAVLDEH